MLACQVVADACVCDRGFEWDAVARSCAACATGFYKSLPGNAQVCDACSEGSTTFSAASVSQSSCYTPTLLSDPSAASNDSNVSNTTEPSSLTILADNQTEVPAVTFNMSLGNVPEATADLQSQLTVPRLAAACGSISFAPAVLAASR